MAILNFAEAVIRGFGTIFNLIGNMLAGIWEMISHFGEITFFFNTLPAYVPAFIVPFLMISLLGTVLIKIVGR